MSLAGEKIENTGQTELDFASIMPEMDSPLNSTKEMMYGTLYSKTSIFTKFGCETCFVA